MMRRKTTGFAGPRGGRQASGPQGGLKSTPGRSVLIIALMIPVFAEAIHTEAFMVAVPGSPLSLARLCFVLIGVWGVSSKYRRFLQSDLLLGCLLIYFGAIMGGLFSDNFISNLSRTSGNILLVLGTVGLVRLVYEDKCWFLIDLFLVAAMVYWVSYVGYHTLSQGFVSYSSLAAKDAVANHHVPGIIISVSSIYLAIRFGFRVNGLGLLGYCIMAVGLISELLIESRSNFAITLLMFLVILMLEKKSMLRLVFMSVPLLLSFYLLAVSIIGENEYTKRRFDITNMDYQKRTSVSRLDYFALGFAEFVKHPEGKGVFGARITYTNTKATGTARYMVHNQYLTYLISGGVTALLGLCLWGRAFLCLVKKFYRMGKHLGNTDRSRYALICATIGYFITLLSVENSGIFFYLFIGFGVISITNNRNLGAINHRKRYEVI